MIIFVNFSVVTNLLQLTDCIADELFRSAFVFRVFFLLFFFSVVFFLFVRETAYLPYHPKIQITYL